jgi:ABC-type Mn2+/Zn2+ transport system ATPase subunit
VRRVQAHTTTLGQHLVQLFYSKRCYAAATPGAPAVAVRSLSAAHPGSSAPAIHGISLQVEAGTRVALVGPNGAGKSTLLKVIAGLLPAQAGEVRVYGLAVGGCHHRTAYLPQRGEIDWRFPITLRRLVLTGRYAHLGWLRRPGARDHEIADAMIARLGLTDLAERQIGELSGGQQQRALVARALTQEAEMLLLDEPFNAVDSDTRDVIVAVLAGLKAQGKTAIVSTHDLDRLPEDFDRVVALRDGRVASDTPSPLFAGVAFAA